MPARFAALRTIRQTIDSSRCPPLRERNTGAFSPASPRNDCSAFQTDCGINTDRVFDHPRIRLTEAELDVQMLALFDKLRVEDDEFRHTFREELRKATNWDLAGSSKDDDNIKKRHTEVARLQGQLLNLRLLEEIDADTYATKAQELRDEAATLRLEIERCDRGRNETIDIAVKAFELSQNLRAKWFAADHAAKRRLLEIVCLNFSLVDVSLVPAMRKPFDLLAEGLLQKNSRGDRI